MVRPVIDIESPHKDDFHTLMVELKSSLTEMSSSDMIDYQLSVDVSSPDVTTFIARVDDKPVGTGSLVRHAGGVAEAKRLYVEPAFRKHGIGRALLRHISSLAVSHGMKELVMVTDAKLDESIAFAEKAGFTRREKILDHAPSKHSIFFAKTLP